MFYESDMLCARQAAEEAQREKERQEADLLISLGRYKAIQVRVIVDFTGVPRSVVANFESRIELFLQLRSRWALVRLAAAYLSPDIVYFIDLQLRNHAPL